MLEEETKVEEVTTETDNQEDYEENDSAGEGESASETEGSEQREPEDPDARKARLKRQAEREAKKQGISLEEYLGIQSQKGGQESRQEDSKEEVATEKEDRRFLKREGYKTKEEQDILLDYASYKGIEVDDIIENPSKYSIPMGEIKALRDKQSTPSPSLRTSRSGSGETPISVLESRYKAGKYLNPDEMSRLRKHMRG